MKNRRPLHSRTTGLVWWLLSSAIGFFAPVYLFASTTIPTITIKRESRVIKRTAIDNTILNGEDIQKSGSVQFDEWLSNEPVPPLLFPTNTDTTQNSVSFRGFGDNASANSLILQDGMPFLQASLLAPPLSNIALQDVGSVEMLQGSQGSRFGNQAVGGVLSIHTKPPAKKPVLRVRAGLGTPRKSHGDGLLEIPFSEYLYGKIGFTNDDGNQGREHSRIHQQNIFTKLSVHPKEHQTLAYGFSQNKTANELPGGLSATQFHDDPTMATDTISKSAVKSTRHYLSYHDRLGETMLLDAHVQQYFYDRESFVETPAFRTDQVRTAESRLSSYQANYSWQTGLYLEQDRYTIQNKKTRQYVTGQQGDLFARLETKLREGTWLTLGTRGAGRDTLDHYRKDTTRNLAWVKEIGLSFYPTESLTFYLRRDESFRFPKANEAIWHEMSQEALHTQRGVSYETGIKIAHAAHNAHLMLYQLNLQNEIAFDPEPMPENPFGAFSNYPFTKRQGVSLNDKFAITPKTALSANLQWVDARFEKGPFAHKRIPSVPELSAGVQMDHAINETIGIRFGGKYIGRRFASDDVQNVSGLENSTLIYHVAASLIKKPFEIEATIDNLFDKHYAAFVRYDDKKATKRYYPGLGRQFLLTVTLQLESPWHESAPNKP